MISQFLANVGITGAAQTGLEVLVLAGALKAAFDHMGKFYELKE